MKFPFSLNLPAVGPQCNRRHRLGHVPHPADDATLENGNAIGARHGVPGWGMIPGTSVRTGPRSRRSIHGRTQPDPLQLADAVRGQEHPGADFAKGWGLLVNRNAEPMGDQGMRGEKAADPAPNDDYV